ncbi:unnamed protein product [Linum trigynum]|uniref:DUF4283 domain-containing protein n=1 Tax=Linum trigynum TaxID=586398 RepID=A0AAV2E0S3_9ROSI
MLSTAFSGTTAPALVPLPSDRPSDPLSHPVIAVSASTPANVVSTTLSSNMIIDSDPLSLSLQGIANGTTQDRSDQEATGARQQLFSYAAAVMGKMPTIPPQNQVRLWMPVGEHVLVSGIHNGEPVLTISADFKSKICAPWHRALVFRLLGLRIVFTNLCNRLKGLWRPQGNMEVKDLDHDYFLVNLDSEQDYYRVLTDGPWVIYDHYQVVQQWTSRFKASDPDTPKHNINLRPSVIADRECSNRQVILSTRALDLLLTQ